MKRAIMIAALAISTSAMAWGDREQGLLIGTIVGATTSSMMQNDRPYESQQYRDYRQNDRRYDYRNQGSRYHRPLRDCWHEEMYDRYGNVVSQKVCREY